MTDKLRDDLIKRADEIDPVLEVEFDTQRCVEQNPYGATEAIEKALYLIRDLRAALAAAPQPMGCGLPCGYDCNGACFDAAAPQPAVADREALVEVIREAKRKWYASQDGSSLEDRLADALLARGLRLPGGEETMAWAVVGEDGEVIPGSIYPTRDEAERVCDYEGERVVPVVICRVVEGGDDAA